MLSIKYKICDCLELVLENVSNIAQSKAVRQSSVWEDNNPQVLLDNNMGKSLIICQVSLNQTNNYINPR